ncbi:uncharacterized protein [Procambarus clarkii]|uniref:uncharacterized protein n=1 Tax=Procambarus clarkii TaxID=6728 RepID=UPI001E677C52|nr:uncharacterized protein LOC123772163 [Procambarus clarkii]
MMGKQTSQAVVVVVLVAALTVTLTAAQTFQYSRGWTNGRKRADPGVGLGVVRDVTNLLADSAHRPSHPLAPTHALPKNMEERVRVLEAGLSALLKVNSATFPPGGGDDDYYADN